MNGFVPDINLLKETRAEMTKSSNPPWSDARSRRSAASSLSRWRRDTAPGRALSKGSRDRVKKNLHPVQSFSCWYTHLVGSHVTTQLAGDEDLSQQNVRVETRLQRRVVQHAGRRGVLVETEKWQSHNQVGVGRKGSSVSGGGANRIEAGGWVRLGWLG